MPFFFSFFMLIDYVWKGCLGYIYIYIYVFPNDQIIQIAEICTLLI